MKTNFGRLVLLGLLLRLLPACGRSGPEPSAAKPAATPSAEAPWFQDVTQALGVDFVHDPGTTGNYFMPEIVGSGGALFDYDNDGRLDILLLQNGGPESHSTHRLYHQETDGRFRDVSAGSGINVAGRGMGVAIGDVNNDGLPDVLITEFGDIRLFISQGGGVFRDVTRDAGLDNPLWGTSAAFFDYDRDGWLDLAVANYVEYDPKTVCSDKGGRQDYCGPQSFEGTALKLYHNLGRGQGGRWKTPRFEDGTVKAGLAKLKGKGLGVACLDFTGDHWPDILVANDGEANYLWINQRNGTFKEEALSRGLAYDSKSVPQGNMGIAVDDVDGDGLTDVFITHLSEELHIYWQQGPAGFFEDRTATAGLARMEWRSTGFGTLFGDFNQDGAPDLALANGAVKLPLVIPRGVANYDSFWGRFAERNQLFANDGKGKFRDISPANDPFSASAGISRGIAEGDIDGDGALDLLVTRVAASARIFKNVVPARGHWLLVRAVDPALGGRDVYGAALTVKAGARRWTREINPGYSFLISNDPRAHFGLGDASRVDEIVVLWPDGSQETFEAFAADRQIVLRKGAGVAVRKP